MRISLLLGVVILTALAVGGLWFFQRTPGRTIPIPVEAQRVVLELKRGGGTVTFGGGTVPLVSGLEVGLGAVITTNPDSTVIVRIDQDSWLTIDGGSTVTLVTLGQEKTFLLSLGRISVRIGRILGKGESLEVKTPNSVAAVRGTRFGVAFIDGRTRVVVLENQVEVTPLNPQTGEVLSDVSPLTIHEQQSLTVESAATLSGQPLRAEAASAEELSRWRAMLEQQPTIELRQESPTSDDLSETSAESVAPAPAAVAEPATMTPQPAAVVVTKTRLSSSVSFVQPEPVVLSSGQQITFQLQEVTASGVRKSFDASLFEWSVDGDSGIGEIDLTGTFVAGPYGGNGVVTALKTEQERVIFERTIRIEVRGAKAPPGLQEE